MESVTSTNGVLKGVIHADGSEGVIRIRPFDLWMAIGTSNAFFLFGRLFNNEPIINIQYGLRIPEGIDTICRVESKDAPDTPPSGTPQIRVDVRNSMRRLFPLEMPMGGL